MVFVLQVEVCATVRETAHAGKIGHALRILFAEAEHRDKCLDVGLLKRVDTVFPLGLLSQVSISDVVVPFQFVDVLLLLNEHGESFETIRYLDCHNGDFPAACLLEVRELCYFHAVEPDFPADTRSPKYWRLPVVLDEPDVMFGRLETEQVKAAQVCVLDVGGGRLDDDLQLVMHVKTVRVLAVSTVCWTSRWLYVDGFPGFAPQDSQECIRAQRTRPYLLIIREQTCAAFVFPEALQLGNHFFKVHGMTPWVLQLCRCETV